MQRYNNVFKQPKIFEENVTACLSPCYYWRMISVQAKKVLSKYLKKWLKCHKANYLTDYQAERLCSLLVYNAIQMS